MSFSAAIAGFARMSVPTVTQAAVLGTVASVIFTPISVQHDKSEAPILDTILTKTICVMASATVLTLGAAFQKKWPLLSRSVVSLSTLFIAQQCLSKKKLDDLSAFVRSLGLIGLAVNIIATSILLYQQRSLPRAIHFAGSLVLPASMIYNDL